MASAPKPKRMDNARKINIKLRPFLPHEVIQPPDSAVKARGLSLRELIKASDPLRMERANYVVHVKTPKRLKTPKGLPAVEAVAWYEDLLRPNSTEAKTEYKVQVVGLDSQTLPICRQKRVLVSCSCADWVYRWEYANAVHGATRVIYGNGQAPRMTNAGNAYGLCKHTLGLADLIMEKKW